MVQLHRESKKNNSSDFFDSSFNIGCQILIVFWHRYTVPDLTTSNDGFSFPTSPNSFFCPTRETDKYKNRMPVAGGGGGDLLGSIEPSSAGT